MIKLLWKKWCCQYTGKYWYYNIIKFPKNCYKFLKEFSYFLKTGYPYSAVYNMDYYFTHHFSSILSDYLANHQGYPPAFEVFNTETEPDKGNEEWEKVLLQMIEHLNNMDEKQYDKLHPIDWASSKDVLLQQCTKKQEFLFDNKQQFFDLFNKYFYDLWD